MHYRKIALLIGLTSVLAACTTTPPAPQVAPPVKKGASQVTLNSVSPVEVPADLSASQTENTFAVPQVPNQTETTTAGITPPGSMQASVPAATSPQSGIAAAESATISGRSTGGSLSLDMPYQQAWTQVGTALPKSGYPVMEQDASSGTYYILDKVGSGGVIKRDTPIYQLHLQKSGDNKTVGSLSNAQNQPADAAVSQRILGAVKRSI